MANKYLEQHLYTYAATPTWNVAQEGDGLAQGASTPATASIVFTGTPSGTISVCGVSVSPSWGSGADAAANGLATAINAATGTVTTTGAGPSVQLRDFVYARGPSGGAPAGTCQIMSRAGSATFNSQVCIAHTLTNVNAGSSSLNFSGGASGAWGWLWNMTATIWPSAKAIGSYGALAATLPIAGSLTAGDMVHVRCNNIVVTHSIAGSFTITFADIGTAAAPVRFVFGDPSVWTGDSADSKFTVNFDSDLWYELTLTSNVGYGEIDGGRTSGNAPRFEIKNSAEGSGVLRLQGGRRSFKYRNVALICTGSNTSTVLCPSGSSQAGACVTHFDGVRAAHKPNKVFVDMGYSYYHVRLSRCEFDATGNVTANSGVLAGGTFFGKFLFDSCKFTGFANGAALIRTTPGASDGHYYEFLDPVFGNVTTKMRFASTVAWQYNNPYAMSVMMSSRFSGKDFILDWTQAWVEYLAARTFPTLSAVLLDGSTPWSWRFCTSNQAGNIYPLNPAILPSLVKKNTLGANALTATVEVAINEALTWTRADIALRIEYVDSSDVLRSETTYDPAGAALTASTSTWSIESNGADGGTAGQVKFDDGGGNLFFNKKKLVVTTAYPVKANTEVAGYIELRKSVSNTGHYSFINPDLTLVVA